MWAGGAPTVLHLHDHELGNLGKAVVVHVCQVHDDALTSCRSLANGFGALQRQGLVYKRSCQMFITRSRSRKHTNSISSQTLTHTHRYKTRTHRAVLATDNVHIPVRQDLSRQIPNHTHLSREGGITRRMEAGERS